MKAYTNYLLTMERVAGPSEYVKNKGRHETSEYKKRYFSYSYEMLALFYDGIHSFHSIPSTEVT